ncbi:hypothetical protein D3C75_520740 [compost metagenome]
MPPGASSETPLIAWLAVLSFQSGPVMAWAPASASACWLAPPPMLCAEGVLRSGFVMVLLILPALTVVLVLLISLAKLAITLPPAWMTERKISPLSVPLRCPFNTYLIV